MSEDDRICTGCRKSLVAKPPISPASSGEKWTRQMNLSVIAVLVIVIAGLLGMRMGSSASAPETVTTPPAEDGQQTAQSTMGTALPPIDYSAQTSKTASANVPAPTNQDPNNDSSGDDLDTQLPDDQAQTPQSAPVPQYGDVRLLNANLADQIEDDGQELVGGSVVIFNDGAYPIRDFQLVLQVNGDDVPLSPFNGTPDNPFPWLSREIEPGEQVEIPVLARRPFDANPIYEFRTVRIRATVEGPPGSVSDTFDVP